MSAACVGHGCWVSPDLDRRGEAVAHWAAATLADRFGDHTFAGLYVATSDSGSHESVAFWRSCLDTGLGFASPKPFPWTLANSPTGRIAEQLGIRGPTYTLVGGAEAMAAAAGHALDDLDSSRAEDAGTGAQGALLVALDGIGELTVAMVALGLGSPAGREMTVSRADLDGWDESESATAALHRIIGEVGGAAS